MERKQVPSLVLLCTKSLSTEILHGNGGDHQQRLLDGILDLAPNLLDYVFLHLPSASLHKLQLHQIGFKKNNATIMENILKVAIYGRSQWLSSDFTPMSFTTRSLAHSDGFDHVRKHARYGDCNISNTAWKTLFEIRWPENFGQIQAANRLSKQAIIEFEPTSHSGDWHQMYWEAHLQDCLDKAAERAVLPFFDGYIGELRIPGSILKSIGYKMCAWSTIMEYSKVSYQCQQYGRYARCLRLQNVLCVFEISDLLKESKLQSLVLRRIKAIEHVNGVCNLLKRNSETLLSLEFINCPFFSPTAWDAICNSLFTKGIQTHGIQYFSIKASSIGERNQVSLPSGFLSFLTSGRSWRSLNLPDNHLGSDFANVLFSTSLDTSGLSILDLSENNISGWLINFNGRFSSFFTSSGKDQFLQSLHMLNLRDCNLEEYDADDLGYLLVRLPKLKYLDISDNHFEDDGIRKLVPYFTEAAERNFSLLDVKIESCDFSFDGATQLLRSLSGLKQLNTLYISDNDLGSQVAAPLAKFLAESNVRVLKIEDIGLGSSGFRKLREEIPEMVKLVDINISKNRGGLETANFLYTLILRAPELVALNAGYNFMPSESLPVVVSVLELSKGKLQRLDLTGNPGCYHTGNASLLSEFQFHGEPIVILPQSPASDTPYDDDP